MTSSAYDVQRTVALPLVAQPMAAAPADQTDVLVVGPRPPAAVVERRPAAPALATSLTLIGVMLLAFVVSTVALSHVMHARAQSLHYAELREQLASGTAPVGVDEAGAAIPLGAPVALLEIPAAGVREVVLEGTASRVLRDGPGHRRDTVLPGQVGTAVVFGRRAAFGGPFGDIAALRSGTEVRVTTGQGEFTYRVSGVRRPGAPVTPPAGSARLTMVTALGPPYLPEEVVRVDAELVGDAAPTPARAAVVLTRAEAALAGDSTFLVDLLLWALALLTAACAVAWLRARWGLRQAWVVGVPVLALLALGASSAAVLLLPNLL